MEAMWTRYLLASWYAHPLGAHRRSGCAATISRAASRRSHAVDPCPTPSPPDRPRARRRPRCSTVGVYPASRSPGTSSGRPRPVVPVVRRFGGADRYETSRMALFDPTSPATTVYLDLPAPRRVVPPLALRHRQPAPGNRRSDACPVSLDLRRCSTLDGIRAEEYDLAPSWSSGTGAMRYQLRASRRGARTFAAGAGPAQTATDDGTVMARERTLRRRSARSSATPPHHPMSRWRLRCQRSRQPAAVLRHRLSCTS